MTRGAGLQAGRALITLFGIWLAVSPWIVGYAGHAHALQDTIVGTLLILAAAASAVLGPLTSIPLWFALALAIWTFLTPMMFGQAGSSFSANSDIVVGLLAVIAAAMAIVSRARLLLLASPPDPERASGQTSLR